MSEMKEKMHTGELYLPGDEEIMKEQIVYQDNMPVHVGRNCWIGAGAIIMPGVTIGDNTVIGAGSMVTKDIPSNVVAVGNPCRVMREINEHDKEYYYKDRKIIMEMSLPLQN